MVFIVCSKLCNQHYNVLCYEQKIIIQAVQPIQLKFNLDDFNSFECLMSIWTCFKIGIGNCS